MEEVYIVKLKGLPPPSSIGPSQESLSKDNKTSFYYHTDLTAEAIRGFAYLHLFFGFLVLCLSITNLCFHDNPLALEPPLGITVWCAIAFIVLGFSGILTAYKRKCDLSASIFYVKLQFVLIIVVLSMTLTFAILFAFDLHGPIANQFIGLNIVLSIIVETVILLLTLFTCARILWPGCLMFCAKNWPMQPNLKRKVIVKTNVYANGIGLQQDDSGVIQSVGPNCVISLNMPPVINNTTAANNTGHNSGNSGGHLSDCLTTSSSAPSSSLSTTSSTCSSPTHQTDQKTIIEDLNEANKKSMNGLMCSSISSSSGFASSLLSTSQLATSLSTIYGQLPEDSQHHQQKQSIQDKRQFTTISSNSIYYNYPKNNDDQPAKTNGSVTNLLQTFPSQTNQQQRSSAVLQLSKTLSSSISEMLHYRHKKPHDRERSNFQNKNDSGCWMKSYGNHHPNNQSHHQQQQQHGTIDTYSDDIDPYDTDEFEYCSSTDEDDDEDDKEDDTNQQPNIRNIQQENAISTIVNQTSILSIINDDHHSNYHHHCDYDVGASNSIIDSSLNLNNNHHQRLENNASKINRMMVHHKNYDQHEPMATTVRLSNKQTSNIDDKMMNQIDIDEDNNGRQCTMIKNRNQDNRSDTYGRIETIKVNQSPSIAPANNNGINKIVLDLSSSSSSSSLNQTNQIKSDPKQQQQQKHLRAAASGKPFQNIQIVNINHQRSSSNNGSASDDQPSNEDGENKRKLAQQQEKKEDEEEEEEDHDEGIASSASDGSTCSRDDFDTKSSLSGNSDDLQPLPPPPPLPPSSPLSSSSSASSLSSSLSLSPSSETPQRSTPTFKSFQLYKSSAIIKIESNHLNNNNNHQNDNGSKEQSKKSNDSELNNQQESKKSIIGDDRKSKKSFIIDNNNDDGGGGGKKSVQQKIINVKPSPPLTSGFESRTSIKNQTKNSATTTTIRLLNTTNRFHSSKNDVKTSLPMTDDESMNKNNNNKSMPTINTKDSVVRNFTNNKLASHPYLCRLRANSNTAATTAANTPINQTTNHGTMDTGGRRYPKYVGTKTLLKPSPFLKSSTMINHQVAEDSKSSQHHQMQPQQQQQQQQQQPIPDIQRV